MQKRLGEPSSSARGKRIRTGCRRDESLTTSVAEEVKRREELHVYWETVRGYTFIYNGRANADKIQKLDLRVKNWVFDFLLPEEKDKASRNGLEVTALNDSGRKYVFKIMVKGRDIVYISGDWQVFYNNNLQGREESDKWQSIFAKKLWSSLGRGINTY